MADVLQNPLQCPRCKYVCKRMSALNRHVIKATPCKGKLPIEVARAIVAGRNTQEESTAAGTGAGAGAGGAADEYSDIDFDLEMGDKIDTTNMNEEQLREHCERLYNLMMKFRTENVTETVNNITSNYFIIDKEIIPADRLEIIRNPNIVQRPEGCPQEFPTKVQVFNDLQSCMPGVSDENVLNALQYIDAQLVQLYA